MGLERHCSQRRCCMLMREMRSSSQPLMFASLKHCWFLASPSCSLSCCIVMLLALLMLTAVLLQRYVVCLMLWPLLCSSWFCTLIAWIFVLVTVNNICHWLLYCVPSLCCKNMQTWCYESQIRMIISTVSHIFQNQLKFASCQSHGGSLVPAHRLTGTKGCKAQS